MCDDWKNMYHICKDMFQNPLYISSFLITDRSPKRIVVAMLKYDSLIKS